jgi:hypothetical protein
MIKLIQSYFIMSLLILHLGLYVLINSFFPIFI